MIELGRFCFTKAAAVSSIDLPDFSFSFVTPRCSAEQYKPTAEGARKALRLLREERTLDWTMLCPSALLEPGARTGKFRLGGDQLLVDADGKSAVSTGDYAVAMIDELEKPAHSRRRFTVGY